MSNDIASAAEEAADGEVVTRYLLRVTEGAGQPARTYPAKSGSLRGVVREANNLAATGFVGGTVSVVDATIDHPDHNVVHVATRHR